MSQVQFGPDPLSPTFQLNFNWEKPSYTSGEGDRIQFLTQGLVSRCWVSPVQIQDEGDWRCTVKNENGGEAESVCGLVVYGEDVDIFRESFSFSDGLRILSVPKSYRIPTFLEELEAKVAENGSVALECKVIGVPTPKLIWFKV